MAELFFIMEENMMEEEDYFLLRQRRVNNLNLHLEQPYWKYNRLSLEDMTDEECSVELRFRKNDIYQLCASLNLPQVYRCYNLIRYDTLRHDTIEQWGINNSSQKSWEDFYSESNIRSSPPPKQCWFVGEVHEVLEKFHVHNEAKCLIKRTTLL